MGRPHRLGWQVKGHPLLWFVVLGACAAFAAWEAYRRIMLAVRFDNGGLAWSILYAVWSIAMGYSAARVGRLCWRMYRPPRYPTPGLCRRCGYDLRASKERCPECGITASGSSTMQART